ncbi:uncharacterized protein E5676_scaffold39G00510 [Cucumis melo var. makuwa]|uniref:Uncharacterized protein n=1 Tax=Cucumis melo var. makuwa TaxID=1194695 RepID=A0A5A7V1U6_CUCMM|nr:uncharacterized protein E6C27_scaffold455G001460 [Cucumis melo var. makuwa]TYK09879.1 uncharacterized protein E5676_scaffold39G00510 [Cucumis melo var. makuwa]
MKRKTLTAVAHNTCRESFARRTVAGWFSLLKPSVHSTPIVCQRGFDFTTTSHSGLVWSTLTGSVGPQNSLGTCLWKGKEEGRGGSKVAWGEFGFFVDGLGGGLHYKGGRCGQLIMGWIGHGVFELSYVSMIGCVECGLTNGCKVSGHHGGFSMRVRGGLSSGYWEGYEEEVVACVWCATIYFIWHKCNHHLHGGQAREPIVLFHVIRTCVCALVVSWHEDV